MWCSLTIITENREELIKMFGSGPNMDEVIFSQFSHRRRKLNLPSAQVLFQLKFTSKQLEKMSKKAEKDQHKEEASIVFVNKNKNYSEIGKWSITSNSGETEKMLGWGGCRKGAYLCGKCNQVLTSKYENLTDGLDDDKCIDFLMFQKEEWIAELSTNVSQSWCHCKQSADCSDHEGMLSYLVFVFVYLLLAGCSKEHGLCDQGIGEGSQLYGAGEDHRGVVEIWKHRNSMLRLQNQRWWTSLRRLLKTLMCTQAWWKVLWLEPLPPPLQLTRFFLDQTPNSNPSKIPGWWPDQASGRGEWPGGCWSACLSWSSNCHSWRGNSFHGDFSLFSENSSDSYFSGSGWSTQQKACCSQRMSC